MVKEVKCLIKPVANHCYNNFPNSISEKHGCIVTITEEKLILESIIPLSWKTTEDYYQLYSYRPPYTYMSLVTNSGSS